MDIISDLRQRHIEAFADALAMRVGDNDPPVARYRGEIVRAAITAGWIADTDDPAIVDDMHPRDVAALAERIAHTFNDLTSVPPN